MRQLTHELPGGSLIHYSTSFAWVRISARALFLSTPAVKTNIACKSVHSSKSLLIRMLCKQLIENAYNWIMKFPESIEITRYITTTTDIILALTPWILATMNNG